MLVKIYLFILSFFLSTIFVVGQRNVVSLSLDEVLEQAGARNSTIQSSKLEYEIARLSHKFSKEWWIPSLDVGASIHQQNGIAMNSDGRFFLDVNRQNFLAGLGANLHWDLNEGIQNSKSAEHRVNKASYVNLVVRNEQLLKLIDDYYELAAVQSRFLVLQDLEGQTRKIVDQLELQVAAGFAFKSDLLLAKSKLNQVSIELGNSQSKMLDLGGQMLINLQIEESDLFLAKDTLVPIDLDTQDEQKKLAERPEVLSFSSEVEALKSEQKKYLGGMLLPEIRAGVSEGFFGDLFSPTDIENRPTESLHNMFQFNASVNWNFPLSQVFGSSQKQLIDQKISQQELYMENSQIRITQNQRSTQAMVSQYEGQLDLATESVDFASEALRQSLERQKMRSAAPYEVFEAQETFLQAQLSYIEVVKKYNQMQYRLFVAMGGDL